MEGGVEGWRKGGLSQRTGLVARIIYCTIIVFTRPRNKYKEKLIYIVVV